MSNDEKRNFFSGAYWKSRFRSAQKPETSNAMLGALEKAVQQLQTDFSNFKESRKQYPYPKGTVENSLDEGIKRESRRVWQLEHEIRDLRAAVQAYQDEVFQLRMYFRGLGYNPTPNELNAFGKRPV